MKHSLVAGRTNGLVLKRPAEERIDRPPDHNDRFVEQPTKAIDAELPGQPHAERINEDPTLSALAAKLTVIEGMLQNLVGKAPTKEWYTTAEAARLLNKRPFTVREYCRHSRIHCRKRDCGRGLDSEWMIAHEEIERIRNHGLLPLVAPYRYGGNS